MKMKNNQARAVRTNGEKVVHLFMHFVMAAVCLVCLYSFLVILGSSFQSQQEIRDVGYAVLPKEPVLDAYRMIFEKPKMLIDSYLVTIVTTGIGTVIGVLASAGYAYTLARPDYRYRKFLSFYVFFTMLFNGGMVPSYILIIKWLGLKDNIWALILPLLSNAWFVLLMKGFLATLPLSLVESAKIDGAGEFRIFLQIIIPISTPAFATVSIFYLLNYWNDWWLSMMYIESDSKIKLQYMLMRILKNAEYLNSAEAMQSVNVQVTDSPTLSARMAMCVLAAGPILVVFPFFQRYFVQGLTVGAVKG